MPGERLDISVNEPSYSSEDSVTISGTAEIDALVDLEVKSLREKIILSVTARAGPDGAFETIFKFPTGALEGIYTVTASASGVAKIAAFTLGLPTVIPLQKSRSIWAKFGSLLHI